MKKNCPTCQALRREAAQPGAPIADLLVRTALHERSPHCQEPPRRKRPKP
ncbi:hypothetical protein ACFPFX_04475 [Streptomyces mauvecolor]|uniref:Uncharacterized protein n=1 Tax=Streptomyces mauvecolor TaxID=58345 RepID=A0ABV9UIC8_9ACTN